MNPEIVVLGGGPAGVSAATLLAMKGRSVRLYEREKFPRFHIGESFMPDTYWVFEKLGMLDAMKRSRFIRKFSVQFVSDTGKESQPFYFFENNPHECSQTWQVLRSEFDQMMLDNARKKGVEVHEESRVLDVGFDDDRMTSVRVRDKNGQEESITPKVVVDATGQSSLIANKLKLRLPDAKLRKASVWSYFRGARREPHPHDEGATLVLQTEGKKGWFWYIPLHDDIISVGVVSDLDRLFSDRNRSLESIFADEVETCPAVKRRLEGSTRVEEFRTTRDFSYTTTRLAGEGWVLVGDALGFLDPIYSSGLQLALRSGMMAAEAIDEGLSTSTLSGEQLGKWGPEFLAGMERMRKLVYAFYDGFSFGAFVKKHPELKNRVTDLLIGEMFKPELDDLWEPMACLQREKM